VLLTILIFIIILAALIFVHELGHFLAAKLSGIRVDEFALGFPPRLFSFKKGETRYALNLIPFGGYVKIFGENPDYESLNGPDSTRSFVRKPKYIQLIVLVAGIVMNVLFAWGLFSLSLMVGLPATADSYQDPSIKNIHLAITEVSVNSPAAKAGLKPGDTILSMQQGSTRLENQTLTPENIQQLISQSKAQPIHVAYKENSSTKETTIVAVDGIVKDKLAVGIAMSLVGDLHQSFFHAVYQGGKLTLLSIKEVAVGLYSFFSRAFVGKADFSQVSGPVGIVGLVGDASRFGFAYLLSFTALISLNLAVINILPFPALDGGRIFFVLVEAIIRRPIKPTIANAINGIGFAILLLLMAIVTFKDIVKLF
jgi:regulator of sigma E protease